jgi:hypothetical protein
MMNRVSANPFAQEGGEFPSTKDGSITSSTAGSALAGISPACTKPMSSCPRSKPSQQLATTVGMTKQSPGEFVEALQRTGFVRVEVDPADPAGPGRPQIVKRAAADHRLMIIAELHRRS